MSLDLQESSRTYLQQKKRQKINNQVLENAKEIRDGNENSSENSFELWQELNKNISLWHKFPTAFNDRASFSAFYFPCEGSLA